VESDEWHRLEIFFITEDSKENRGFGTQITVAGVHPAQNNYPLSGIHINNYANGAPASVLGGNFFWGHALNQIPEPN